MSLFDCFSKVIYFTHSSLIAFLLLTCFMWSDHVPILDLDQWSTIKGCVCFWMPYCCICARALEYLILYWIHRPNRSCFFVRMICCAHVYYLMPSILLLTSLYEIGRYLASPDDMLVLDIAYSIYMKCEEYPSALQVALFLDNIQVCLPFFDTNLLSFILSLTLFFWERMIICI